MQPFLISSIQAALAAGKAILKVYSTQFEVYVKSDASPVTQADLQASDIIKERLLMTGLPFVSEEDLPKDRSSYQRYWLVDPLDGTKEFVKRNGEFTVNIALVDDKKPVMGVVYAPVTDTLWYNRDGKAYKMTRLLNGKGEAPTDKALMERVDSAQAIQPAQAERPFTVLVSRSHRSIEVDEYIEKVLRPVHPDLVIDTQGSSLKFARLAEGSADVYVCYSKTKEWDTAAAEAVLRAAGGQVLRISDGQPLEYSKAEYPNPPFVAWAK